MERYGGLPRVVFSKAKPLGNLFAIDSRGGHCHVATQRQEPESPEEPARLAFVADTDGVFIGGNRRNDHRLGAMLAHEPSRRTIASPQVVVEVDEKRRIEQARCSKLGQRNPTRAATPPLRRR